jgi:hypothetical protein
MSTFIEYDLGNGATILVESLVGADEAVKAGVEDSLIIKAKKKFQTVLNDVQAQSKLLLKEIESLNVNEAEVKFGLAAVGELGGSLVIGKVGGEINYEVTLKWKRKETTK